MLKSTLIKATEAGATERVDRCGTGASPVQTMIEISTGEAPVPHNIRTLCDFSLRASVSPWFNCFPRRTLDG